MRGISGLISVTQRVRRDYESGGVTIGHYNHLLDSIRVLKDLFQANLFQRLLDVLEARRLEGDFAITGELLRHYHTAGYITTRRYYTLLKHLDE